jgi:hypothetical protein
MEAVVALAIIGLFALALLSTTSSHMRTASKARVLLTARTLAEDRISAIQLLEYDELADLPDTLAAGVFPEPFRDFTWSARVEEMKDEYDLFGVEVVVAGQGESFPLRTLVHSPRPQTTAAAGGTTQGGLTGRGGGGGQRGGGQRGGGLRGQNDGGPRGRQGGGIPLPSRGRRGGDGQP